MSAAAKNLKVTRNGEQVVLAWETTSTTNVLGYLPEESVEDGPWTKLPLIPAGQSLTATYAQPKATKYRVWDEEKEGVTSTVEVGAAPVIEPPHEEPADELGRVQVDFAAVSDVSKWQRHEVCLAEDSYLWKLVSGMTVHSQSAKLVAAMKELVPQFTQGSPIVYTNNLTNDWGTPLEIGRATDPSKTIKDTWSDALNFHVRGAVKANNNSDAALSLVDGLTNREDGISPYGNGYHDLGEGPGVSAGAGEPGIPFVKGSKAIVQGGTNEEVGGATSARMAPVPMLLRFQELIYATEKDPYTAILHPLAALIAKGTMAARGNANFGYGINADPAGGRNPFVAPARQGETTENAGKNPYAPPMGMRVALNWTQAQIEAMSAVPTFIKAIYMALSRERFGFIFVDVQGSPGIRFYNESLRSYTEIGNNSASEWLKKNADGKYLKESSGTWSLDITGGGTMTAALFSAMMVLAP